MFKVINDIFHLIELRQKLYYAYQKNKGISFYSPDYIIAAIQYFISNDIKNELYFIVYYNKELITHYLPFYIDKNKTLRFIFDKHTDYCSCIGPELTYEMVKELTKLIIKNKSIKKINLENLKPDDDLLNYLNHFLGIKSVISCYNNHSFISASYNKSFFSLLKSKEKSELKRLQNKNAIYHFKVINEKNKFPKELIKSLRDQMIFTKIRNESFFNDSFISFTEDLFNSGELEVFTKWDNESIISASLVFKNHYSCLRMVWVDFFSNIQFINLSSYIDYLNYLENEIPVCFSFGRGSYDYKAKNFQPQIQNLYNLRFSKSRYNFIFSHFYGVRQFIKILINSKI